MVVAFLAENWAILLGIVVAVAVGIFIVYSFIKLPTSSQISALKEWLKYAVTMAEKELGSGTGQLKLRMVYDLFVGKFSWLASFISFDKFSSYVDEALEWLNSQLESNKNIAQLVNETGDTIVEASETANETSNSDDSE